MKGLYLFVLLLSLSNCSNKVMSEEKEAVLPSEDSVEASPLIGADTLIEVETEKRTSLKQIDTLDLLTKIRSGEKEFDFYASFTEPFRTLYFIDTIALFDSANDGLEVYTLSDNFNESIDAQTILLINSEKEWTVIIEKGQGSDGMSEINFPYKISLNGHFFGGGGEEFQKEE